MLAKINIKYQISVDFEDVTIEINRTISHMASEYYLTLFIEKAYIKSSPKNMYLAPTKSLYTL